MGCATLLVRQEGWRRACEMPRVVEMRADLTAGGTLEDRRLRMGQARMRARASYPTETDRSHQRQKATPYERVL